VAEVDADLAGGRDGGRVVVGRRGVAVGRGGGGAAHRRVAGAEPVSVDGVGAGGAGGEEPRDEGAPHRATPSSSPPARIEPEVSTAGWGAGRSLWRATRTCACAQASTWIGATVSPAPSVKRCRSLSTNAWAPVASGTGVGMKA